MYILYNVELVTIKHSFKLLLSLLAKHFDDHFYLLNLIIAGEDRFSEEHFCKDTSGGPDVNCGGVFFPGDHDFWGAVPPSRDVVGEYRRSALPVDVIIRDLSTREAKVADLQVAVLIK